MIREVVACRVGTTCDILPQDEDLDLVFRRAVLFNDQMYWRRCLESDLTDIVGDKSNRYLEDGKILLCSAESIKKRKGILNKLNSKCTCGSKAKGKCCISKRYSCKKAGKLCGSRCRCPHKFCENAMTGGSTAGNRDGADDSGCE